MAELTSSLVLSLVDKVTEPARKVEQRMRSLNDRIEKNNRQVAAATGKLATAAAGAAAFGGALIAPIRAAGNFESAMADIRKVVDFPTPEAVKQLETDILNLSKTIPLSAEALAAITAEAGGELGRSERPDQVHAPGRHGRHGVRNATRCYCRADVHYARDVRPDH